jgi:multicomponent Na+:H+ antiporter subunit D
VRARGSFSASVSRKRRHWRRTSTRIRRILLGCAVSAAPGLGQRVEQGAARLIDRTAYAAEVLDGRSLPAPPPLPYSVQATSTESLAYGAAATALAFLGAAAVLWRRRLPVSLRRAGSRVTAPPVALLRAVHSGVVGDYVLYVAVGIAVLGGVWALALR